MDLSYQLCRYVDFFFSEMKREQEELNTNEYNLIIYKLENPKEKITDVKSYVEGLYNKIMTKK